MTLEPSVWRANDAVQFDSALRAANDLIASLFIPVDAGLSNVDEAVTAAADVRHELNSLDGFDRDAVDDFIRRLEARVAELKGLPR